MIEAKEVDSCGNCFSTYYKTFKEQQSRSRLSVFYEMNKFNMNQESNFEIPNNQINEEVYYKEKKAIDSKVNHVFQAINLINKVHYEQMNIKANYNNVYVFNHCDFLNKSAIASGIIIKF